MLQNNLLQHNLLQRSYSLPSCTLLIEGVGKGSDVLSILSSFGCRFNHHPEPIVGGLDLLKSLVQVVGAYTQALNSNTSLSIPTDQVSLEPDGKIFHLLSVQLNQADANNPHKLQIKLDTLQLFDLMEGLDQLCCDPLTLPDIKLVAQITDHRSQTQFKNQAIPAITGAISLIVAATVLYFIPTPKPQPKPQTKSTPTQTQPLPKISNPPTVNPPTENPTSSASPDSSPSASPN